MRCAVPRPGLTLTEVLVSMFVMALGLMALLTLFPLGAQQVGQALKDDRTAQTALQADAWLRVYWRDAVAPYDASRDAQPAENALAALDDLNVTLVGAAGTPGQFIFSGPPVGGVLPGGTSLSGMGGTSFVSTDTSLVGVSTVVSTSPPTSTVVPKSRPLAGAGPSYPVLLDPIGFVARGASAEQSWGGRNAAGTGPTAGVYGLAPLATPLLLPRRNVLPVASAVPPLTPAAAAYTACALTDDLTYQPNGGSGQSVTDPASSVATAQPLGRQGRYTWSAVVQRPDNSRPQRAKLTVLVFDGRPTNLAAAGDEAVLANDPANNVLFVTDPDPAKVATGPTKLGGARSLVLTLPTRSAEQAPLVRRGGWLAVAVIDPLTVPASGTFTTPRPGVRRLTFHRVTGLTTDDDLPVGQNSPLTGSPAVQHVGGPQLAVTPVAVDLDPPLPADPTLPAGSPPLATQVMLFANLSEVFERPDLTP